MAGATRRVANLIPTLVLRSPLHPLMSRRFCIIEFTGRKSGRRYATPVAYCRDGDRVLLSTDSPWWRNLSGGATVRLRLGGRTVVGTGTAVTDPDEAHAVIRRLVDAQPSYGRLAGISRARGSVSDAEIARSVAGGRVAIEVVPT